MKHQPTRGMTLIDVVVGTGIALVIFLAIFALLRASAELSTVATETAAATAIAESQMEYIRSLPYASVGTVGGIPAGAIPQEATTTEDGIPYAVRTFIDYYDDPADGTGESDTNGITTDYKRAKVSVSYTTTTGTQTVTLVSNVTPVGIESTTGGGTLRVVAVDSTGTAVPGATVTIVNASTSPAVDLTTYTDSTGVAYLPGAAAATGYEVTVTKDGYSTAKTYDRDDTNQNPSPGHLTVAESETTSSTFAIDLRSSLTIDTFSPVATSTFSDSFDDASELASTDNATVSGGALTLPADGNGGFLTPGSARSVGVGPSSLARWGEADATLSVAGGSSVLVHVTDGAGNLIPDSALPGNGTGFTSFPIDLSTLSTTTYPVLALSANLAAGAGTAPGVEDWSLSYAAGPIPLPNVSLSLTGAKTIGSTGAGAPIYKTTIATSTGAGASVPLSLEWDTYALSVSGYDIVDACPMPPYNVLPGTTSEDRLILGPATANALLVSVADASGNLLPGASVTLSRTGYSATVTASSCGTAYFGDVSANTDYALGATSGTLTASYTGVPVSGFSTYAAILQ